MGRAAWNEDQAAGAELKLTIPKGERRLSISDVERFVGVRVQVKGRRDTRREQAGLDDVGARHLSRTESDRLVRLGYLGGMDDSAAVDRR